MPDSIDILCNITYLDLFNNYKDLAMLDLLSTANDLRQKYLLEQCYLINCLKGGEKIERNNHMTNTPFQDRWGIAGEKFTPIPWVLLQKSGSCPPYNGADVKLNAPQQLLLIQLLSYWWLDSKGHPFPSYAALATRTGLSRKTIGSHLIQLEKKGWLKRIKRWHEGNNYSGWFYDLDPTVRRLKWLTKLPQEKQQIPEDAEGPGLPEGSEAPVEVTPEPAAPPV
ncbi:MAG: helix-turn-helix domain-containing protein [Rhodospirillaceae bacterium]|nr:helix-turn-helix domain-containing protein [Rhodospirillaceae bacterium]